MITSAWWELHEIICVNHLEPSRYLVNISSLPLPTEWKNQLTGELSCQDLQVLSSTRAGKASEVRTSPITVERRKSQRSSSHQCCTGIVKVSKTTPYYHTSTAQLVTLCCTWNCQLGKLSSCLSQIALPCFQGHLPCFVPAFQWSWLRLPSSLCHLLIDFKRQTRCAAPRIWIRQALLSLC